MCVCASCVIWAIDEPRGQSSAAAAARGGDIARNNRDRRNSRNSRNNRNKPGGTGGERGPGAILRAKAQYGAIWRNMVQKYAIRCNKTRGPVSRRRRARTSCSPPSRRLPPRALLRGAISRNTPQYAAISRNKALLPLRPRLRPPPSFAVLSRTSAAMPRVRCRFRAAALMHTTGSMALLRGCGAPARCLLMSGFLGEFAVASLMFVSVSREIYRKIPPPFR